MKHGKLMKRDRASCNLLIPINEIIGKKLDDLGVYYEILIFSFGEYEIHASCFTRIIHNQDILVTTQDYQSWDEKDHKHNDMWYNVSTYGEVIVGGTVQTVEISPVNDLIIILDNGIRIELLNSNGYHHYNEEIEQWFFNSLCYFFVVYINKYVILKENGF